MVTRALAILLVTGGTWTASAVPATAQVRDPDAVQNAVGKKTTVTLLTGQRVTGTLTSLSATDVVVFQDDQEVRHRLTDVGRVTVANDSWITGLVLGAVIGGVTGFIGGCGGDEGGCYAPYALLGAGMGAGAGAGIGAVRMALTSQRRQLYVAPTQTAVTVAPLLAPGTAGLGMTVRW